MYVFPSCHEKILLLLKEKLISKEVIAINPQKILDSTTKNILYNTWLQVYLRFIVIKEKLISEEEALQVRAVLNLLNTNNTSTINGEINYPHH